MKIVIVSDTHGEHDALGHLTGDVLIHCGDFENLFQHDPNSISNIDAWFGQQNFKHIFCIGGNHDLKLERYHRDGKSPFKNAIFLHDRECIVDGVKFYGSSWVPQLDSHAFYGNDDDLKQAWARIPEDVDVLITHTPPHGRLDVSSRGLVLGCKHLRERLRALNPTLHCFGHVHASSGNEVGGNTTFLNAANVNSAFEIAHPPFEFYISPPDAMPRKSFWSRLL